LRLHGVALARPSVMPLVVEKHRVVADLPNMPFQSDGRVPG